MTKTCCPKCKSSDELGVELKQSFDLSWSDRRGEFEVEHAINDPSALEDNSEVTCSCGWSGRFYELKPVTEKYRVVLIMDVDMTDKGPISRWDWKDLLDLHFHEDVTVDGVNKL